MPALVYSSANFPFTPFTKIYSADVNTCFTDIRSRLNWAGGTSATTGLNDDNIQSLAAAGGGLTRATKLKAGTASYVVINDGAGAMSEEQYLATARGGLNANVTPAGTADAGKSLVVNAAGDAYELSSSSSGTLKVFNYYQFA